MISKEEYIKIAANITRISIDIYNDKYVLDDIILLGNLVEDHSQNKKYMFDEFKRCGFSGWIAFYEDITNPIIFKINESKLLDLRRKIFFHSMIIDKHIRVTYCSNIEQSI